jgi:hypothetical protein
MIELDEALQQRGGDPGLLSLELQHIIAERIESAPRSLQAELGPSEVGDPCARRIGHKLAGSPERTQPPKWKATVGTAIHAWLADCFDANNLAVAAEHLGGQERWLIEQRVDVGDGVTGTADLYDRVTATVVDWKSVGPTMLKGYRKDGPGEQYRRQLHLYGLGLERAGLPVDAVMIVFLPRQGELSDGYAWHEAYSAELAADALERYRGVRLIVDALGDAAPAALPMAPAWCGYCPFYGEPAGCPGHPDARPSPGRPALTIN